MGGTRICCCGSRGWTGVMGWLELTLTIIAIIALGLLFFGSRPVTPEDYAKAAGKSLSFQDREQFKKIHSCFHVMLLVELGIFLMAIILLKGSYGGWGKPGFLHVWVFLNTIALVLYLIRKLVGRFYDTPFFGSIIFIVGASIVGGFFIWVANTHKKEMIRARCNCGLIATAYV